MLCFVINDTYCAHGILEHVSIVIYDAYCAHRGIGACLGSPFMMHDVSMGVSEHA